MEIAVLAAIGLLLLAGIIAFAVGNRGWSIGTVVAALLVVMAAAGFLYLATRLAARDAAWAKALTDLELQVARARDGVGPAEDGRLAPLPDVKPLTALREERDRWSRAAATVDTWRDRFWSDASYEPDGGDGPRIGARIVVPRPPRQPAPGAAAPGADAQPNQPPQAPQPPLLSAGATIYLFDESPLAAGGRYLGAFTVREAMFDAGIDGEVLSATLVGEPNERERKLLSEPHGPVTIYDELPVDRWIAFFRTGPPSTGAAAATARNDVAAQFDGIDDEQVRALVQAFVERFEQHDAVVPEDEWGAAIQKIEDGTTLPGTFWATVEFTKSHVLSSDAAGSTPREFAAGDRADFDLKTALELRDTSMVAKVLRVVRRRPLSDALAAIYGTQLGAPAEQGAAAPGRADGALALARQLRAEIVVIENARQRLDQALTATTESTTATTTVVQELTDDLGSWQRDAKAATDVGDAFAASVERTTRERDAADRAIVSLGRELAATLSRLTAEIDRVAPAPVR